MVIGGTNQPKKKKSPLARDVKVVGRTPEETAASIAQNTADRRVIEKARNEGKIGGDVLLAKRESAAQVQEGIKAEEQIAQTPIETAQQIPSGIVKPQDEQVLNQNNLLQKAGSVSETFLGINPFKKSEVAAFTASNVFKKIENNEDLTQEDIGLISQLQLNDLDIAQIKAGNVHVNRISEWVASVPLLGKVKKRVGGTSLGVSDFIAETPSSNINGLLDSMQASKTNIAVWATEIKNNPSKASTYLPLIESQEEEIRVLESRIKLMSIQQKEIQANPEIYNNIQKEINDILTKTGSAKTDLQLLGIR